MKLKNKAFTLTELLIAIGIIGAIAAVSIPSLVTTAQNRMHVTKLKSINQSIKQLADKQLAFSPTKDMLGTDFADPDKLLTLDNFNAVKVCANAGKDCWRTTETGTKKVQYRALSGVNASPAGATYKSIQLKNGAVVGYTIKHKGKPYGPNDILLGEFCYDINGPELPNRTGRDYFCMYITQKGQIVDLPTPEHDLSLATKVNNCKNAVESNYCYGAIVESGWKMPY